MVPVDITEKTLDPVEMLNNQLHNLWQAVCEAYDASASIPEVQVLFAQAVLTRPCRAAETVVVNMLLEVMEGVCRFSPWYTRPPRAFGLISTRENVSNQTRWSLAPEAAQRWEAFLKPLSEVIQKYSGLVQAILLVDDLMGRAASDDPTITACCSCLPPRAIQIKRSVLVKAEILCDQCRMPYVG